jgi:hypothetical protein
VVEASDGQKIEPPSGHTTCSVLRDLQADEQPITYEYRRHAASGASFRFTKIFPYECRMGKPFGVNRELSPDAFVNRTDNRHIYGCR